MITRVKRLFGIYNQKFDPEIKSISYFSLFQFATKFDKFLLSISVICSIVTGVSLPFNAHLLGSMTGDMIRIGKLISIERTKHNATAIYEYGQQLVDTVTLFALYNILVGIVVLLFSYFAITTISIAAFRQVFTIRNLYFKSTLNQDISWYDVHKTGDFSSRISDDMLKLDEGIGVILSINIHHQTTAIICLIMAFVRGWKFALICLVAVPAVFIAILLVGVTTVKYTQWGLKANGVASVIAEEVFSSIRTVIAFGGQEKETERYNKKLILARNINIKKSFFSGLGYGLLWFIIFSSYALAFWYGVKLIIRKEYGADALVTIFICIMMASMNFGVVTSDFRTFNVATAAGAKIFHVIKNVPIINKDKYKGDTHSKILGKLTFNNVNFHYPSRPDVPVLQEFNLIINPGETVALVGSSGCGKSTCIQLLQRFYDPISGTISLDDKDIRSMNLVWLRENIGVVGQEPVLFGTTIEENIRFGNLNATKEEIIEAAKKANAHDFITKLPEGYDTLVGERGKQLSEGQKQRISIARALVRNPKILLLDEATSALDTNSEAKVQAALDNASKNCTTIIVAHRLTTIRNADKIVVVSEGQVVEEGTHDELMALKQNYYDLVTTQVHIVESFINDEISVMELRKSEPKSEMESLSSQSKEKKSIESSSKRKRVHFFNILREFSPEWLQIIAGCIASFIMGMGVPVFAVLLGDIIQVLTNPDTDYVVSQTNKYNLFLVIAGAIAFLASFSSDWMFGIASERLIMRLKSKMFKTMLQQEIAWFDKKENGVGSLCYKLSSETAYVQSATGAKIGALIKSGSVLLFCIIISLYFDYRLGLVALAIMQVIVILIYLQLHLTEEGIDKIKTTTEAATKLAVEALMNIRTVVSLGREDKLYEMYVELLKPTYKISRYDLHLRGFTYGAVRGLIFVSYAICVYYGGMLVRDDNLEIGIIFKVSQALIMGTSSIAHSLAHAPNFQRGIKSAIKIFQLFNRQPKISDSTLSSDKIWSQTNIEYTDVNFHYPTRPDVKVLKDFNLLIQQGNTVALVGQSGCGKSTLIHLLERFYDPDSGRISIDNRDIKSIKLSTLRSQMGIVSQDHTLFDRTIGENIAYGDNSRTVTQEEIIEAAKKANIHHFIISLPLGYDTYLGEKGTQISGGQKQRIAIARALLRDPKILLLDEATSALDTKSEKIVQDALDKAKEGRTCIIIAHRLSTIQDANVIYVISHGKIAEMGTHSELINQRGLYYQLHSLQSS